MTTGIPVEYHDDFMSERTLEGAVCIGVHLPTPYFYGIEPHPYFVDYLARSGPNTLIRNFIKTKPKEE